MINALASDIRLISRRIEKSFPPLRKSLRVTNSVMNVGSRQSSRHELPRLLTQDQPSALPFTLASYNYYYCLVVFCFIVLVLLCCYRVKSVDKSCRIQNGRDIRAVFEGRPSVGAIPDFVSPGMQMRPEFRAAPWVPLDHHHRCSPAPRHWQALVPDHPRLVSSPRP